MNVERIDTDKQREWAIGWRDRFAQHAKDLAKVEPGPRMKPEILKARIASAKQSSKDFARVIEEYDARQAKQPRRKAKE